MSTREKTRVRTKNDFNQDVPGEGTGLMPRVETTVITGAEVEAILDKIIPKAEATKYTEIVYFADQQEADSPIEIVRSHCTRTRKVYEGVRRKKHRVLAEAAVVCFGCTREMMENTLSNEGINYHKPADGALPIRGLSS